MRIGEVIRYYRKKEKLTQEQVANYLNISAPAVNKWENERSYPDITLLAPLARLLKIDINTLLAFNQVLSTEQVDSFVDEVIHLSNNSSYQTAFEKGCELIKQYPGCDELIFWIATALRIELLVSSIKDKDKYERKIIKWLQLIATGNKGKISSMSKLDLSSIYRRKKEYDQAQGMLDTIPDLEASKTFQQAALFKSQGKLDEAYYICEDFLLNNVNETLNVLIVIISMLGEERKFDEAEYYLESAKKHIQAYDLGVYHEHSLELMLAKIRQDKERVIKCIINMFNEANSINNTLKSKLFRHRNAEEKNENNNDGYRNMVIEMIRHDTDLDFVKNDSRIKIILNQYTPNQTSQIVWQNLFRFIKFIIKVVDTIELFASIERCSLLKSKNTVEEYYEYRDKIGNRTELYRIVSKRYGVASALYPGSHIDIAPSLVIPKVIYVDNFKGAINFFKNMEMIKKYIDENKEYEKACDIVFIGQDYTKELNMEPVDLIISQYAGFVGQATKKYLNTGGILLCNDSHGDATLSRFDDDFEFIGVIGKNNRIIDTKLDDYFVLPRSKNVDLAKVKEKMKGPKYKLTAENYLFRKVKQLIIGDDG